jgi:hypothetical protein
MRINLRTVERQADIQRRNGLKLDGVKRECIYDITIPCGLILVLK